MTKAKAAKKAPRVKGESKAMRYDWDKVLDGTTRTLTRGQDFTGTARAAASMVRYRARQRGAKVTAEATSDTTIRVSAGDQPKAGRRTPATPAPKAKATAPKKADLKAVPDPTPAAPLPPEPAAAKEDAS